MKRKLFLLCLILCAAVWRIPAAYGADGGMRVKSQSLRDGTLFFTLELSAPGEQDLVYVAAYAESGRMTRAEVRPAAADMSVTFQGVADADSVKAVWVRPDLCPVDAARVYSAAARTYEEYAGQVADILRDFRPIVGKDTPDAVKDEYVFARLIVRTRRELPSFTGEHLARKVSDMEGNTVLQFDSPDAARICAERLEAWLSEEGDGGDYVIPDTPVRAVPIQAAEGSAAQDFLSWGVKSTRADAYAADLRGRGITPAVTVAVLDSGVDSGHAFLDGRLAPGYDFVDNDGDPQDESLHGTHVAGTVVDCTPELPNIKIMPVRVLDAAEYGSSMAVNLGIRYAADHGADVINLSLDGAHSAYIDEAVDYAISKNVVVVVAAGNEKENARNYCPAHIPACITVSAVDSNLNPAKFNNFGAGVDLAAPGVGINSAMSGGGYQSKSGTSVAAPHVSACAAMLRAEFPALTPAQVKEQFLGTLRRPEGWDTKYGAGVLDMQSFIKATPRNLFAVLYEGGELAFQDSLTPRPGKAALKSYQTDSGGYDGGVYAAWYPERKQIQSVSFETDIYPSSTALWFYDCENLTGFQHMERLHTDNVTDMSQMFSYCSSLRSLDLRGFRTAKTTNTNTMFFRCAALADILVSDGFTSGQIAESKDMFEGCASLVGGAGTKYDREHTDKEYARIDGGADAPGYFSAG